MNERARRNAAAAVADSQRVLWLWAVALPLLAVLLLAAQAAAAAGTGPEGFANLAEKLLPAVVNVSTTQTIKEQPGQSQGAPEMPQVPPGSPFEDFFHDFFDHQGNGQNPQPRHATSLGSGFIIDPGGLIVTNNHVIQDADEITVILHDNTSLKAELVGHDPKMDLAVLRVKSDKPLPFVKFGNSDDMRVGDWVLAIGNPFGLGGTVTAGIISARARDINAGPYDDFLQTDASINKGNSGGPMFNLKGEVIGINTAIFSPTGGSVGIGFAIPSSLAQPVVEQLRKFGRARRGWLGVRIQQVTPEIADSLGLDHPHGALIASVTQGGPAEAAGIKAGDVVTTFDGKDIPEMRVLPRVVAETEIDTQVPVTVWRGGKQQQVRVKVGELPPDEEASAGPATPHNQAPPAPPAEAVGTLGFKLSGITKELRQQFGIGDQSKGVVVTEVTPNSPAAEKGLRPGDVIVEVSQEAVAVPQDVMAKIAAAKQAGRHSVLLLVDHNGDLRFVALGIG